MKVPRRLKELLALYASDVGGEFTREVQVATPVEKWTIVLNGEHLRGSSDSGVRSSDRFNMKAKYLALDAFEFKVRRKLPFHDLRGRIFGSRDIDIGGGQWQRKYRVESNDAVKLRSLLSDETYLQNLLAAADVESDCSFELKNASVEVLIAEPPTFQLPKVVRKLVVAHNLIVETLHGLVELGSASPEGVDREG